VLEKNKGNEKAVKKTGQSDRKENPAARVDFWAPNGSGRKTNLKTDEKEEI